MSFLLAAVGVVAIVLGLVVATDRRDGSRPPRQKARVEVHAVWAAAVMFIGWLILR